MGEVMGSTQAKKFDSKNPPILSSDSIISTQEIVCQEKNDILETFLKTFAQVDFNLPGLLRRTLRLIFGDPKGLCRWSNSYQDVLEFDSNALEVDS